MKKVVAAIFAHPDDEAFGPAGTIAKFAKTQDVYILCATRGEAGEDHRSRNYEPLWKTREKELLASAKILGVKKVFFLDFQDGTLCNNLYHNLAAKIQTILNELKPKALITTELRGISGHIDHITVALATTYVFERLPSAKTLLYYCITKKQRAIIPKYTPGGYFIYMPPGYDTSEIDKVIDISDVWEVKLKAMNAHQSQLKDVKRIQKIHSELPREENFLVLNKD